MKFRLLTLAILLSNLAWAQSESPIRGNQQWIQYYGQASLNDRWSVSLDGGFRVKNELEDKSQYIVRAGLGYSLGSGLKLAAGFAHLGFYGLDKVNIREFRPYQEAQFSHQLVGIKINHRMRLEERFYDPFGIYYTFQSPNTFTLRWRYGFSANIELFHFGGNKRVSLTLGDEIFLNLDSQKETDFFDQNRLVLSPTLHLNDQLSFALTWNRQASFPQIADKHQYNSVLWLQIKHNFSISRTL